MNNLPNFTELFLSFLTSSEDQPSKATVKNYRADISQFLKWFEKNYGSFKPEEISAAFLSSYKQELGNNLSLSSVNRHLSSLRKFFTFLKLEGYLSHSPFEETKAMAEAQEAHSDPWRIKDFKNHLYVFNASHLTIKNYIIDVKQFLTWAETVLSQNQGWEVSEEDIFSKIDSNLIEEYKKRLINEARLSPVSVNRKLSSLRRYISWAQQEGIINSAIQVPGQTKLNAPSLSDLPIADQSIPADESLTKVQSPYSWFPPLRLLQKGKNAVLSLSDGIIIYPLVNFAEALEHLIWKRQGMPVTHQSRFSNLLSKLGKQSLAKNAKKIANVPKSFYAPAQVSTKYYPLHRKVWHHLRNTRPNWYRRYQNTSTYTYFRFAIMVLFVTALSYALYSYINPNKNQPRSLAVGLPNAPNRKLSFQGRLTDASDNPITATSALRMAIYDSPAASGSSLLWQEIVTVSPDSDGIFSTLLGNNAAIPQSVFANNKDLYLGVTVGQTPELSPRQQIATVGFATNAEFLQGLPPITNATNSANVILALNSSGNLVIGNNSSPTFQATGGTFTIAGQTVNIQTNTGSAGNVQLAPDGIGEIDIQKPIFNSTLNNNISKAAGAVEVDDNLAVLATSSGVSAFTLNNNSTGDLISASSSATPKFTVDKSGFIGLGGTTIIGSTNSNYISSPNFTVVNTGALSAGSITSGFGSIDVGNDAITTTGTIGTASSTTFTGAGATFTGLTLNLGSDATGDLYYRSAGGGVTRLAVGTAAQCLIGGTNPTWGSCASGTGANFWTSLSGALYPTDSTSDLLIGSNATSSAEFTFTGLGLANHQTQASVSGKLIVMPNNGYGNMGIGTTTPATTLDVNGITTAEGRISLVGSITNGAGTERYIGGAGGSHMSFNVPSGNSYYFQENNATKLTIDSSGNLIAAGTLTGLTGITSSGTIKFSGLSTAGVVLNAADGTLSTSNTCSGIAANIAAGSLTGICGKFVLSSSPTISSPTLSGTVNLSGVTGVSINSALYTDGSGNLTSSSPGTGTIGYWQRNGTPNTLTPTTQTDGVLIGNGTGGTTTAYQLQVDGAIKGKALAVFNEEGDQSPLSASESGKTVFNVAAVSSAVNGFTLTPSITTSAVGLAASGTDTNIGLTINGKGSGTINLGNTSTGNITLSRNTGVTGDLTVTSAGSSAFTVGRQGSTSPAFRVNASSGTQVTGLLVTANDAGSGAALSLIGGNTNENLTLDAKGSGTLTLQSAATGKVQFFSNLNYVDSSGNASISGNLTLGNGSQIQPAYGDLTLAYKSGTNAWSAGVTLDTVGNVGIGTTAPTADLDVAGTTGKNATFASGGGASDQNYIGIGGNRALFGYNGTSGNAAIQGVSTKGIEFNVNNNTFGSGTAMTLTSTGKLGIGIALPNATLDVVGSASVSADLTIGNGSLIKPAYGPLQLAYKSSANAWQTGIYIQDVTGNVGIKDSAPTTAFSIAGVFKVDSNGNIVKLNNVTTNFPSSQGGANSILQNDGSGNLSWLATSGTGAAGWWTRTGTVISPTNTGDSLAFGSSSQLTITNAGNLTTSGTASISGTLTLGNGGGTIRPDYGPLQLNYKSGPNAWQTAVYIQDVTGKVGIKNSSPLEALDVVGNATASGNLTLGNGSQIQPAYGPLTLAYKVNATTWNPALTVDTVGNVGIGTTAPAGKLQVQTTNYDLLTATTSVDIGAGGTGGGWARAFRAVNSSGSNGQNGGAFGVLGSGSTPTYAYMAIPTSDATGYDSTKILVLNNSGNVGINTTGPDRKLDVLDASNPQLRLTYTDGSVYTDFQTDASGNLTINATGTKSIIADDLQVTGNDIQDSGGASAITFDGSENTQTNGNLTVAAGKNFTMTSGGGTFTETSNATTASNVATITADSLTNKNVLTLSGAALTTGNALSITGPSSGTTKTTALLAATSNVGITGTTTGMVNFSTTASPTGGGSSVGLFNSFTNSNSTLANTGYGIYNTLSDAVALENTNYGIYTLVNNSGALNAAATKTVYGSYIDARGTGATTNAGIATNVYGQYITTNASHATDNGTVNQYGLYIKNGTSSTNGTSTKYGLYVEQPTGADTNYAAYFAGGNVNIQGLTASSGVYTDVNHNLTSTAPTSGAVGYWTRSGTTLSPATANDVLSVTSSTGGSTFYSSGSTSSSTNALTTWLRSPKNTVTAFVGDNDSTSGYVANDVSGNIRFNGAGVAWGDFGYYPNGGGNGNQGNFRFSTAGSSIVTTPNAKVGVGDLYASGNVGIGTTSPSTALDVNGVIQGNNEIRTTGASSSVYSGYGANFIRITAGSPAYLDTNQDLAIRTNGNPGSEVMRLQGGKVGIGTAVPGAPLQISGGGSALPATSGSTQSTGLNMRIRTATGGNAVLDIGQSVPNSWIQATDTSNYAANYNLLLNPNGGNVGIGDTSPASLLTVGSGDKFQVDTNGNVVKLNNVTTSFPSSQGAAGSLLANDGSGNLTWGSPSGTGTLGYWSRSGTTLSPANPGDNLTTTGSLGIGTGIASVSQAIVARTSSANLSGTEDETLTLYYTDSSTGTTTTTSRAALSTSYTKSGSGTATSWNGYNINVNTSLAAGTQGSFWGVANRTQLDGATVTGGIYDFVADAQYGSSGTAVTRAGFLVNNINLGGTQTLTNQYGVLVNNLAGATSNYGIGSQVSSGSNNYNIYASGTAQNYFAGNVGIGTTSPQTGLALGTGKSLAFQTSDPTFNSGIGAKIRLNEVGSGNGDLIFTASQGGSGTTDALTIYRNGNVGIGTTAPSSHLSFGTYSAGVAARMAFYEGASSQYFRGIGMDSNGTDYGVGIWAFSGATSPTDANAQFVVRDGGNVGIGTVTPGYKLDVNGSINIPAGQSYLTNPGAPNSILMYDGATGDMLFSTYYAGSATGDYRFRTNNGANERLTILGTGNVGIGTTAPSALLSVGSGSPFTVNTTGAVTSVSTAGQVFFTGHQSGAGYAYGAPGIFQAVTDNTTGSSNTYFQGVTGSTTNFSVRADGQGYFAGNVGIGTTGPTAPLDVLFTNSTNLPLFDLVSSDTAASGIVYQKARGSVGSLSTVAAGDNLATIKANAYDGTSYLTVGNIRFVADATVSTGIIPTHVDFRNMNASGTLTTNMTILPNGNVGIGLTGPNHKLQVTGSIHTTAAESGGSGNLASDGYDLAGYTLGSQTSYSYVAICTGNGSATCNSSGGVTLSAGGLVGTPNIAFNNSADSYINNSHNVGIGTTGPNTKLEVAANSASSLELLRLTNTDGGYALNSGEKLSFYYNTSTPQGSITSAIQNAADGNYAYMAFSTRTSDVLGVQEKMRILANGNVGIGNTAPGALLDVGNAGATLGVIRLEGNTSGYAAIQPTAAAGNVTITLPANTGTVAVAGTSTTATQALFATTTAGAPAYRAIADADIPDNITISLAATATALAADPADCVSAGTYASGINASGTATGCSQRLDSSGTPTFSTVGATTFTGALSGNATTATTATNWGTYGGVPTAGSVPGANGIARADVNGYTYFNYINSNTANNENPAVSQVIVTNGTDGYYRKSAIANFTTYLTGTASSLTAGSANAVSFNGGLTTTANVTFQDITAIRPASATTGVIYLGNTGTHYVFFDGTNYNMPNGQLYVNGVQAVTNSGTWGINVSGTAGSISGFGNPTSSNTGSTIVYRDGSGNFSAGTITAALTGHASSDLALTGGTMSGDIAMGTHNISGGGTFTATTFSGALSGNATTATTALYVSSPDGDRTAGNKLPTTSPFEVRFDFANASTTGTGGNYAGVMTYAPWVGSTASTGDASYQLAFGSTAANGGGIPQLNIRKGIDSTWNSWYTILHSGNYNNYSPTLTGTGASGTWGINVSGTAGSISGFGNPTSSNTGSTIVYRDGSGNFSAGTITAALTGHASSDLALTGGTMSGDIAMGTHNISGGGTFTATTFSGAGTSLTGTGAGFTAGSASTLTTFGAGGLTEIGRYLDFHGGNDGAVDWTVRLDASAGTGTNNQGVLALTAGGSSVGMTINGNNVWHAGDDGAGSGLDADVLDGLAQTSANTVSTIVARNSSGNFSAGTITATDLSCSSCIALTSETSGNYVGTVTGSSEISVSGSGSEGAAVSLSIAADSITQGDIAANAIGTGEVKNATASTTCGASDFCSKSLVNGYTFFPSFTDTGSREHCLSSQAGTADPGNSTARWMWENIDCGSSLRNGVNGFANGTATANYNYITASDHPAIWVVVNPDNSITDNAWEAEDPVGQNYPENPNPIHDPIPSGYYIANPTPPTIDGYKKIFATLPLDDQQAIMASISAYIVDQRGWTDSFTSLDDINKISDRYNPSARQWVYRYLAKYYKLPYLTVITKLFTIDSSTSGQLRAVDNAYETIKTEQDKLAQGPPQEGGASQTDNADIAELYQSEVGDLEGGDVVSIGNAGFITKSTEPYARKLLGVISTTPAWELGQPGDRKSPLALTGRVPVKISDMNGPVEPGDSLTSSPIPGYAMKATQAGEVIGKALDSFNTDTATQSAQKINDTWETVDSTCAVQNESCANIGKIEVYLNLSFFDPDVQLANDGNLSLVPDVNNNFKVQNGGQDVTRIGAFAELVVAKIKAGLIDAQSVTTNSLSIATDNITVAGQKLSDYIGSIVDQKLAQNGQSSIVNGQLSVDIISPLDQSESGKMAIKLNDNNGKSRLEIQNASGSAVATIDSQGNATLSGQLSANSASISGQLNAGDASISGTLHAGKIIADDIEGLNSKIGTLSATTIINNTYISTPSADTNSQLSFINDQSSGSANFNSLFAKTATFEEGLMSFGSTSLYEASVADKLYVGSQLSIADSSINVLGGELKLQPLATGGVSFVGDQITIDTDGNLKVNGNADFAKDVNVHGTLFANIIAPLPNQNLNFKLATDSANIEVKDASDAGVLLINNKGDINASGAGTFSKLNLSFVPQALAISDTEVAATASAGTVTLKANKPEITIDDPLVTADSLIYITPVGQTYGQSIYLSRQVPGISFTAGISLPVTHDIKFNFLIIN